jgi:non-ribosomal peptide synthetase component F
VYRCSNTFNAASNRAGVERVWLSEETSEKLKKMSRREAVTIYMALLAALKVLLHRYTGQEEIIVGTPMSGRARVETEGLIGMMVNTVALKVEASADLTVREMLKRVREAVLEAEANQEAPFERVVERVRPQRDGGEVRLVEVMMSMERGTGEEVEVGGLKVKREQIQSWGAKVGLNVVMSEEGGRIGGRIEYRRGEIEADSVKRMSRHLEMVIRGMSEDAGKRIGEIGMMSEEEKKEIVYGEGASESGEHNRND